MLLPWSFLTLLFTVSAAQNMTTSLLTLLFAKTLEPQQSTSFWLFMSWLYWFSPVTGWISDICGNRKVMLFVGIICNIGAWYAITYGAFDFTMFTVVGLFQNGAMLFVNSALNGALVEVSNELNKKNESEQQLQERSGDDASHTVEVSVNDIGFQAPQTRPSAVASAAFTSSRNDGEDDDGDVNLAHQQQQQPLLIADQEEVSPDTAATAAAAEEHDAAASSLSPLTDSGATQSEAMIARTLGSVIGAVIMTFALVYLEIRPALAIGSACYGIAAIVALFAKMNVTGNNSNDRDGGVDQAVAALSTSPRPNTDSLCSRIQSTFRRLRQLCDSQRGKGQRSAAVDVTILLVFIFCNNMLPDATSFYMQYVFDAFEFPNWFNSCFQLVNLVGALAACEVYRRFLSSLSQTSVFIAGCLAAGFSYTTGIAFATGFTRDQLHISNPVYLMVDAFVVGFLNRIAFMPVLHVAAARCPKGFEAVVFELFSLAAMGGATVASLVAIRVADALSISRTNWSKLWILMLVAAVSRLLPLFVVPHLPPPVPKSETEALAMDDDNREDEETRDAERNDE